MKVMKSIARFVLKPIIYRYLERKGVIHFRRERLYKELMVDLLEDSRTSLREKLWCYQRGFLSDKLMRYRLTEETYKNYLSDIDFYLSDNYRGRRFSRFFDDKLMTYFLLNDFKENIPKHYFHNDLGILYALDIHPYSSMAELVAGVGSVAAKKAAFGRHGEGFVKFSWSDGVYSVNGTQVTADQVNAKATELNNFIFTEYAINHADLVPAASLTTMVFRAATIYDPELGVGIVGMSSRWQRTGTSFVVDQPGGVQCGVDVETGAFFRPIDIGEHEFAHEGVDLSEYDLPQRAPYFEEIKKLITAVASFLPYAPYLSFDIAVTDRGPLILEINSHGMPRALQMFRPYFHDERARKLFKTSW